MALPRLFRIKQKLEGPTITDLRGAIHSKIHELNLHQQIKRGQSIAITAGSRGITDIDTILRSVVDECKALGLKPFIIPAMGSHGGATALGQKHILEHLGITELTMGCPIKSSMQTIRIGEVRGIPVFCDKNAWAADYIAVVARVKPHTDFGGEIESGLFKMMAIGLGKRLGAETYHRAGQEYGYAEVFPTVGKKVLDTGKIRFGIAIVENGYGNTARIEAILPVNFYETEKNLLQQAKSWLGKLPFDAIDLLIVDEIGKNISGTGMDPNVIGRKCVQKHPDKPNIRQLFVRDLTQESDGNAHGIGMADLVTKRLADKIGNNTKINAIAAGAIDVAKTPLAFASDHEAIVTALGLIGLTPTEKARIVRIKNTLHLTEMYVSEAFVNEVKKDPQLSVLTQPTPMSFDIEGNLPQF